MKLNRILAGLLAVAMLASMTACGDDKDDDDDAPDAATSQSTAQAPDVDLDKVVYSLADQTFTLEDYVASYNFNRIMMDSNLAMYGMSLDDMLADESMSESYAQQLQMMGTEQLTYIAVMVDKAKQEGITVTEDQVEEQYDAIVANYESEDAFEAELAGMGMTDDLFMRMLESDLIAPQLEEIYLGEGGKREVDAAEVRAQFDETYLRAKHVLISTVGDDGAELENQDELEALANEIADRAQAGEDFDALIAEYGEDPGMTAEANADGYVFGAGEMVEPFYQGALALDMDGISEPIKSDYGWHIIQRLPLRDEDFATKEDIIRDSMLNFQTLFAEWAEEYPVEKDDLITTLTDGELVALGATLDD